LCPSAKRLSLVTLFSLFVSIEDRPLLWMVVRSQTYYPEHILAYGSGKARCSLVVGFYLFPNRLIGGGERWRSKHHSEARSQVWGLRVQVWTGTWTPRQEWNGLVSFVPRIQARHVFRGTQLGCIGSRIEVSVRQYDLAMV
jgi:hypothetical protein